MNWINRIFLLVALFLLFAGCDRNPGNESFNGIEGPWNGIAIAGYPGPADELVTDTARIHFLFENGEFTYSGSLSPTDTVIIQHGSYTEKGDTLWLEPENDIYNYHPLYLTGSFKVELEGSSLRLYQTNNQSGWTDYHDIDLMRTRPMPD